MFKKHTTRILVVLVALLLWGCFTWPLPRHFGQAIPCSDRRTEGGAPVRDLIPGDHLQLLYHFWLARDMLAGHTPWFSNLYEFNLGNDAARAHPEPYYVPFSLIYAALSPVCGEAVGWNVAGLMAVLLGIGFTFALARRYARDDLAALLATLVGCAFPYRWITLLNGSPTGFGMGLVPMLFYGLDVAVRDRRPAGGWLAGTAWLCAFGSDLHVFYFGALAMPAWCLLAWCAAPERMIPDWTRGRALLRALLPALLLALLALILSSATSSQLARTDLAAGRSWDVVRRFSPTLRGLCSWRGMGMSNHVFFGGALTVLLAAALVRRWREHDEVAPDSGGVSVARPRLAALLLLAGMLLVVALALGANGPLHGFALRVCRKLLPKYDMIRQTVKIYCLMPTLLAALVALLLPPARRWLSGWNPLIVLCALLTVVEFRLQITAGLCGLPRRPGAYTAISAHAAAAGNPRPHAIVLPLWPGESHWSSIYEYEITRSRVRLVNGYAPSVPAGYAETVFQRYESMNQGAMTPAQATALRALGVRYVVFHEQPYPEQVSPFPAAIALRRLLQHPLLDPLGRAGPVWCFALRETPRAAGAGAPLWGPPCYPAARHWQRQDAPPLAADGKLDLRLRAPVAAAPELRYLLRARGPGLLATAGGDRLVTDAGDWHWRELACQDSRGELLSVSGGAPRVTHALLTAGDRPQVGATGVLAFKAADLFHGGCTDPSDGSVLLDPNRDPQGLALYGPCLPLPPGRYRVRLAVRAVTGGGPAGAEIGRLIPALTDGRRFGDMPVRLDAGGDAVFDYAGDQPLRIEFHYHRTLPVRLCHLDLTKLPEPAP